MAAMKMGTASLSDGQALLGQAGLVSAPPPSLASAEALPVLCDPETPQGPPGVHPVSFLVDKLVNVVPRTSLQVLRTVVLGPRGCYGQDGGISPSHPGPTWRTGPTQLPGAPHTPSSCCFVPCQEEREMKEGEKEAAWGSSSIFSFSQPSRVAPS